MHAPPTNAMTTPEIKGRKFQGIKGLEKTGGVNNYVKNMKKQCT